MQAKIHWSSFLRPLGFTLTVWCILGGLFVGFLVNNPASKASDAIMGVPFALAALFPLLTQYLRNRFTVYRLTPQSVQMQEGILGRSSTEIPLNKINDLTVRQTLFQRLFGAGDVRILTGNDTVFELRGIENPQGFSEAISARLK